MSRARPAIERREERIRSWTPSRNVEIANVEIERITENLKIEVIMCFRLNNLRNLSGICQEKILFSSQLPSLPVILYHQIPTHPAHIHLKFNIDHWRPGKVPAESVSPCRTNAIEQNILYQSVQSMHRVHIHRIDHLP